MTKRNLTTKENEDRWPEMEIQANASRFACEDNTLPSICVVEAVAEALETDPKELQPLYEAIDPDALDRLFESPDKFQRGCIMFRYEGCNVTVDAGGWIAVSSRINDAG